MFNRNNSERMGAKKPTVDGPIINEKAPSINEPKETAEAAANMAFTTPTTFVDLPSKGRFYPEKHPLHGENDIEIRYMTAKDEDILTSRNLLKKGVAIDRMLTNIIVDKKINIDDLLIGDKNAIVVAARTTGYGAVYRTSVTCPICGDTNKFAFDLEEKQVNHGENCEEHGMTETDDGTFIITVPNLKAAVEVRLLTGHDEKRLLRMSESKKKHSLPESPMTDQFLLYIVSVNGDATGVYIKSFIDNLPALDSRHLRDMYRKIVPNVNLDQNFSCLNCETFFLLKYYGGWSFYEAYNLPVGLRNWFMGRLQSQIEKENEQLEKARSKAKK